MISIKKFHHKFIELALIVLPAIATGGCSGDDTPDIQGYQFDKIRFTDSPNFIKDMGEIIYTDYSEHDVVLSAKSVIVSGMPMPKTLYANIYEWDDKKQGWTCYFPSTVNEPDDFYHVKSELSERVPVIRIHLKANDTGMQRKIKLEIESDLQTTYCILGGTVTVIQNPATTSTETFTMTAKYKGRLYTTEAEFDTDGNYIFHNDEYAAMMRHIDSDPSSQMVVMGDGMVHYYDNNDIKGNQLLADISEIKDSQDGIDVHTRSNLDSDLSRWDLGYFVLYDNDTFRGDQLQKGLDNFHFTWNLPNLKPYGMNDKITSIAVGYKGYDKGVCSVLTVWDDADYNSGDDYRKKHRISIIATKECPLTSIPDLKKVKKIGSSKSWNDCISSISFHFGYPDRLLLDF